MVRGQLGEERQGGAGVFINIKRDPCQVYFGSKTSTDKFFFRIGPLLLLEYWNFFIHFVFKMF